jgi:hypothetical protein
MKRLAVFSLLFIFISAVCLAKDSLDEPKILLLISERNSDGVSMSWWAQEAEFSVIETNLSKLLESLNCLVVDTKTVNNLIKRDRSLKTSELTDKESVRLARVLRADYIVKGAVAVSVGSNIYTATNRPFFATAAVKLIRVKDGQIAADLDGIGSSLNLDISTGDKEALSNAAADIAAKVISHITKEGGK